MEVKAHVNLAPHSGSHLFTISGSCRSLFTPVCSASYNLHNLARVKQSATRRGTKQSSNSNRMDRYTGPKSNHYHQTYGGQEVRHGVPSLAPSSSLIGFKNIFSMFYRNSNCGFKFFFR